MTPLSSSGRRVCYYHAARQLLALGLLLTVFLPTLVVTVSAHVPVDNPSENEHFVIYRGQNGDTVCRQATEAEARELEQIRPTGLKRINHLQDDILKSRGLTTEDLPQHLRIILQGTPNLSANPAAEEAFRRAAAAWESVITSPITIYIDVDYGPTNFGATWGDQVLGSTSSPATVAVDYAALRRHLIANGNSASKLATWNALPANSIPTDLGTETTVRMAKSIARAIGFSDPTAPIPSPQPNEQDSAARIGFNSLLVDYDFDGTAPINGTDFEAVATHEIGHALGFTSRSGFQPGQSGTVAPAMWDLYRFRSGTTNDTFASAPRIMTIGGPALNSQWYFVPGQTQLGLSNGGPDPDKDPNKATNNSDGNQSSHWRQASLNGFYIGIMDPRIPGSTRRQITANDINALDIFGYNNNGISQGPPLNNNFASAQTLAGCSGTAAGTNVFATREANEQENHSPDGLGGNRSVWYQWQAPATGIATIDTLGTGFDTVLGVYTGDAVGALNQVGKNDDFNERTSRVQFAANAGTVYKIAVDGFNNQNSGGDAGPITINFSETNCAPSFVLFSAPDYSMNEAQKSLTIDVTRTGSTGATATVNYATSDNAGLTNCTITNGLASERCDYGSAAGTLRFGPGETVKSITIPLVNDGLGEGNETFSIALSAPSGMSLAAPQSATVHISDSESRNNPADDIPFFVTQQYIDFLGRLPDPTGFANWVATLSGCPNGGFGENLNPGCDRVHVSAGFFLSAEFQGRGYFAYRFYEVALDRRPTYAEFVPDLAMVGGPQSPESEVLSKQSYTDAWLQRPEFKSRYDNLSNTAYVNALESNAEVTVTNKQSLIDALNGGQLNRGQVLRNIVESQAVADRFFNRAFVSMQYFGYLRRDPDTIGFQNWVNTLNADPSNFRHMIFGFIFSTEYRQRFGL